ncbi:MAG TPA: hypothetical protein VN851_15435 [Thermoanaerobaculia bacterium]|nr:hypothetical protein [Thermoanaerobaculia bacterium]
MKIRRALLLLPLLAFVSACFDGPVRETWTLRFLSGGWVVAGRTIVLSSAEDSNPAVAKRLAAVRRDLLEGSDPWAQRIGEIGPIAEKIEQERFTGSIAKATHRAVLTELDQVRQLFAATPIAASYTLVSGLAELRLVPGPPDRATRTDRQKVQRAFAPWSADVAAYFSAGSALWAYLDKYPGRARACFGRLFHQVRPEGAPEPPPLAPGKETQLVDALFAAMKKVWQPLEVAEGEGFTLDELSHLVWDPFPAPVEIQLPGPAIEIEGFEPQAGHLVARGPGFWLALEHLEGRWLTPDPVLAFVRESRKEKAAFDLDNFLGEPRRARTPPSGGDVQKALQAELAGAPQFLVTWKTATDGDEPAEPDDDFDPWKE